MADDPTGQRKVLRAGGIKRRKQILEATLRVILKDGIRGVRHRAVAEEAKVPLASTTYYFKDIEELLSETFLFWNHSAIIYVDSIQDKVFAHINDSTADHIKDPETRTKLANVVAGFAITFVLDQIEGHLEDRVLELAFHHEATRNKKLRHVVRNRLNGHRDSMEQFYRLLGSSNPKADAQVTISLMLRLEQEAVMDDDEVDTAAIENTLNRHIQVMFLAAVND
ncbi:TetR/AcrR family transcriptional regulator [Oceanicoccus sagamiensis]|uniref:HTH tetR-type domain-containing protein n=1 Tax=Oceanicoccus sagamiensis TaxID=716816 RepID=A0A1X9NBG4_9GAMM|nr:TetR family transcriptional regulator [Oceanicoccus sagamiensis]ARN73255.1 hypothetical protein BST96_03515 [Oceanicoccus sagamiensis]